MDQRSCPVAAADVNCTRMWCHACSYAAGNDSIFESHRSSTLGDHAGSATHKASMLKWEKAGRPIKGATA